MKKETKNHQLRTGF